MGETEHLVGKLIPVEIEVDAETTAMHILTELGMELDLFYYKTALDQLDSEAYKKYVVRGGAIYKVEMSDQDPHRNIFKASKNADGSYDFEVKYYNGGCSFYEAIDAALDRVGG